jgi:hypothetical protein
MTEHRPLPWRRLSVQPADIPATGTAPPEVAQSLSPDLSRALLAHALRAHIANRGGASA